MKISIALTDTALQQQHSITDSAPGASPMTMRISDAQREIRDRFAGGFYGQLVSGILWLGSAWCAVTSGPRLGIIVLAVGGMFIFPLTESLIRVNRGPPLSAQNGLHGLGRQVAFVLPATMPLLIPIVSYRLNLFYPAMMVLLGAHYLPFVFLYGMRMFWVLALLLLGSGILIAAYGGDSFSTGGWITGVALLVFAALGRTLHRRPAIEPAQRRAGAAVDEI